MYRRASSLREVEDMVNDPIFTNSEEAEVVVTPPESDEQTGEDNVDDND